MFALANNHIMDYGEEGMIATIEAIGNAGGKYVGCRLWTEAYKPLVISDGDLKVAILSISELQFGILHDKWTQSGKMGCAWINHVSVDDIVVEAKASSDYVIVFAHAGLEGLDVPLPEWRERYRRLVDCGDDCVIGGHTHIMQEYEIYKGKPFFYSGGNFMFAKSVSMPEYWWKGYGVQLDLSPDRLDYKVFGTHFDNKKVKLEDSLCLEGLGGVSLDDDYKYLTYVDSACVKWMDSYNMLFSTGGYIHIDRHWLKSIVRWLLGRCQLVHVLNNLQCESHRWTISRALRLNNGID